MQIDTNCKNGMSTFSAHKKRKNLFTLKTAVCIELLPRTTKLLGEFPRTRGISHVFWLTESDYDVLFAPSYQVFFFNLKLNSLKQGF